MLLEDFIISVYCLVDSELKNLTKERPLRARGFAPKLSDAEVITMDIVGEFMGKDTDKGIWQYFKAHWQSWFPCLGVCCSKLDFEKIILISNNYHDANAHNSHEI